LNVAVIDLDRTDYYGLLGVPHDASDREIHEAFRNFARTYHPDRFTRATEEHRTLATAIYRRGSEAMQVLTDADARRLYDRALEQGILRLTAEQRDGAARAFELHREKLARDAMPRENEFHSMQARALFERGNASLSSGDARAAWKAFTAALEHEPDHPLVTKQLYAAERALRGR
jgi:curved DNA-binding protein CbpA